MAEENARERAAREVLAKAYHLETGRPISERYWMQMKIGNWAETDRYAIRAMLAFAALQPPPSTTAREVAREVIQWAVDRWRTEVEYRPLGNIHRRTLDDVWRQVIRYFDGDDVALLGPCHDVLLALTPAPGEES